MKKGTIITIAALILIVIAGVTKDVGLAHTSEGLMSAGMIALLWGFVVSAFR